jgi:hypothetical protein
MAKVRIHIGTAPNKEPCAQTGITLDWLRLHELRRTRFPAIRTPLAPPSLRKISVGGALSQPLVSGQNGIASRCEQLLQHRRIGDGIDRIAAQLCAKCSLQPVTDGRIRQHTGDASVGVGQRFIALHGWYR